MTNKLKVKIVKKDQIGEVKSTTDDAKSTRVVAREMVSNVTEWVTDFKSRKSDETKAAIEKFFAPQPQPSEL